MKSIGCCNAPVLETDDRESRSQMATESLIGMMAAPPVSKTYPRRSIEHEVSRLMNRYGSSCDRRRDSRLLLVRPAQLSFTHSPSRECASEPAFYSPEIETAFEVVTTDFSFSGAGILALYEFNEPLPRPVRLEISGVTFACELRWKERVGCLTYRYGLKFCEVLDIRA